MDLFQIKGTTVSALPRVLPKLEREIQRLLEGNLETVFGIRFVASEYSTGERHGGRVDTLGIDENNTPVVIEYKLSTSVNIITQGLSYLDWLLDHRGDFEMLVTRSLGTGVKVDWTSPRVLLVADSFATPDLRAVAQMGRNIQLTQYKLFTGGILAITVVGGGESSRAGRGPSPGEVASYSIQGHLDRGRPPIREMAEELRRHLLELGEDVSEGPLKDYLAYRTTRNLCCLEVHREHLLLYLTLDPALAAGYPICRDVTCIGHYGTGNVEVRVTAAEDVMTAKDLIKLAYKELSGDASA